MNADEEELIRKVGIQEKRELFTADYEGGEIFMMNNIIEKNRHLDERGEERSCRE